MKERGNRSGAPPSGSRTGPRARAFQERQYGDPYQRAERPDRKPPWERLQVPISVRLDPDVARVFRDPASVNEALRLVIRLARFGGGRPSGPPRDRAPFRARDTTSPPRKRPVGRPARPPRFNEE